MSENILTISHFFLHVCRIQNIYNIVIRNGKKILWNILNLSVFLHKLVMKDGEWGGEEEPLTQEEFIVFFL